MPSKREGTKREEEKTSEAGVASVLLGACLGAWLGAWHFLCSADRSAEPGKCRKVVWISIDQGGGGWMGGTATRAGRTFFPLSTGYAQESPASGVAVKNAS